MCSPILRAGLIASIYPNLPVRAVQYFVNTGTGIRRASWPAMFKKLKQKIEEGGESGIEKVAFSPRKLPGVVVRSPSQSEQPPPSQNVESTPPSLNKDLEEPDISSGSRDEDQGVTIEVAPSIRGQGQVSYETCLNMTQSHV